MKTISLILSSALFLSACGSDSNKSDSQAKTIDTEKNQVSTPVVSTPMTKPSSLLTLMSEEKVCGVLDSAAIQSMFNTTAEIKTSVMSFGNSYSCDYSWDRTDREERESNVIKHAMLVAQGKAERLTMRQKISEHQFNVSLSEYKGKAEYFVPRKLSDEELQAQIDRAKKAASDRLTDDQKAVAGDAASSMVESMLKKNNQNTTVDGVGDAAFWSKIGMGGLNVLDGTVKISISPMIGDTVAEDLENAKKIAALILQ